MKLDLDTMILTGIKRDLPPLFAECRNCGTVFRVDRWVYGIDPGIHFFVTKGDRYDSIPSRSTAFFNCEEHPTTMKCNCVIHREEKPQ